ncbi:MAG: hypothetical protein L3J52_07285 [Proteobacteria bacterium]|nr:hypothetical protein [Pseudomonadota bacterium]
MKRRSKEQWQEIIAKQQHSGLSAAQFCRNEKIDQKYFSTRKRQLIKESKSTTSVFARVKIDHSPEQDIAIEYQYKNSTIKFTQMPKAEWLDG